MEWCEIQKQTLELPLSQFLEIIDDALVHGFQFKVENGIFYCTI